VQCTCQASGRKLRLEISVIDYDVITQTFPFLPVTFNARPQAIYPFEVRVTSNGCELSRLLRLFSSLTDPGVTGTAALDGLFFSL